jgi:hypothetical protein
MSTRINVTVGDGGLLDRNAQQTAANRQARVLADQRAAAEAEGVERRAADRTAAGLDPLTGLPASTPSSASTINRLDQEPAANRREGGVLLEPKSGFVDYGGTLTGVRSVSAGPYKPSIFSRFSHEDTTEYFYGRNYPEMEFLPTGGPDGKSGALQGRPVFEEIVNPTTPLVSGGDFITEPVASYLEQQELVYAAVGPYDTVLNWQYPNSFSIDRDSSAKIVNLSGDVVESVPRAPAVGRIKSCTHEMYVRLGGQTVPTESFIIRSENRTIGGPSMTVFFALEGLRYSLSFTLRLQDSDIFSGATASESFVALRTVFPDQYRTLSMNVRAFNSPREGQSPTTVFTDHYTGNNNPALGLYDPKLPADIEDGSWFHLAVVRTSVPESNLFSRAIYFNGVKIIDNIRTNENWVDTFGKQPVSARITLFGFRGGWPPSKVSMPSIHGYRFTPRALYSGDSFTPSPAITRLA